MFLNKRFWPAISLSLFAFTACKPVEFNSPPKTQVVATNPTAINGGATPSTSLKSVNYTTTVAPTSNLLDIVLVVDDSNSMLPDNQKLAANMANFITNIQNSSLDWQMCVTTTSALANASGAKVWGASIPWQSNASSPNNSIGVVLRKGTANLSTIFTQTINYIGAGWEGTDDERAIKAMVEHVYNGDYNFTGVSGCYRRDAAISYIIISDEDEHSIGGDAAQKYYSTEDVNLNDDDKPEYFVSYVKNAFGSSKRFTVNSIIVKPEDSACMSQQDSATPPSKSHYGRLYAQLSGLTGGGIGSICDSDYSPTLNLFLNQIRNSLGSVPLECTPVGNVQVSITPATASATSSRVDGTSLIFTPAIPEGSTLELNYQCVDTRTPSSFGKATKADINPGFFARVISFFKNLF